MNQYFKSPLSRFRTVALMEGVSFLLLLFIAMPLKYLANIPEPVKYLGWMHGLLFVLYIIFLLELWVAVKWPFKKVVIAFLASLIPFGTFILEKKWLSNISPKDGKTDSR